jgi:hypothetical protein
MLDILGEVVTVGRGMKLGVVGDKGVWGVGVGGGVVKIGGLYINLVAMLVCICGCEYE